MTILVIWFMVVSCRIHQFFPMIVGIPLTRVSLFRHCPSLFNHAGEFDAILESWKEYKMTVPTYGAILLDPSLQFVSLFLQYIIKLSVGLDCAEMLEFVSIYLEKMQLF